MRATKPRPELTLEQLQNIAFSVAAGAPITHPRYGMDGVTLRWFGDVLAKERPRAGANGHFYTPKATQIFEAAVKDAMRHRMQVTGIGVMFCPVAIHFAVYESIPQSWGASHKALAGGGVVYPAKRDLDNQVKAVMDAVIGVAFHDDKQVVQLFATKQYGDAGFALTITPCGLSATDAENVAKLVKLAGKK